MQDSSFNFPEWEPKINQAWQEAGCFEAALSPQGQAREEDLEKKPFVIIMPPPNVTGRLHLGHALSSTIQDILVRFWRMNNRDVLWLPGTDHAGIATQIMVEKKLLAETNKTPKEIGRDAFVEKVWEWKKEYGHTILDQMKRMGFSPDWRYLTFTLDSQVSQGVQNCFVKLYEQGLIYRDERLVNWDPHLQTALSDLEVVSQEEKGVMWYLRYQGADFSGEIQVATTRPETIFGDQAVAVHPEDPRYQSLVGKKVKIPVLGKEIPIIQDLGVQPDKGTGAVKITPAHDFLDFEIGKRHHLETFSILDPQARGNQNLPKEFQGQDRFDLRKATVQALEKEGSLVSEEPIVHNVPYSDRSGVPIEPRVTKQWFISMESMARSSLKAVHSGETTLFPENWYKTYDHWLNEIQPWCISRQLWWGHRLPVWYDKDQNVYVALEEEEAKKKAFEKHGREVPLSQDEDVLDTWFSSALWPFTTLGWPQETSQIFKRYFPSNVLVTGADILFFWVARMMMMSLKMTQKVPFHHVVLHPLIRDEKGKKMSKTKGNVVDPMTLVERYGADALRYGLILGASPAKNMRFSAKTVEKGRNCVTKLWNAGKFVAFHSESKPPVSRAPEVKHPGHQWMVLSLAENRQAISQYLSSHQTYEAAHRLYSFFWHDLCDTYLELCKGLLKEGDREETVAALRWVFQETLKLAHPFMPFVTERLWQDLYPGGDPRFLTQVRWAEQGQVPSSYKEGSDFFQEAKQIASSVRSLMGIFRLTSKEGVICNVEDRGEPWSLFQEVFQRQLGLKSLGFQPPSFFENKAVQEDKRQFMVAGRPVQLQVTSLGFSFQAHYDHIKHLKEEEEKRRREDQVRLEQANEKTPEAVVEKLRARLENSQKTLEAYQAILSGQ